MFRGFEQLSSFSVWRVMAKCEQGTNVASVVLKMFCKHVRRGGFLKCAIFLLRFW